MTDKIKRGRHYVYNINYRILFKGITSGMLMSEFEYLRQQ